MEMAAILIIWFLSQVDRIGPQHQAGSDSLLTGLTFFRMKQVKKPCFRRKFSRKFSWSQWKIFDFLQLFFEDSLDDGLYRGHLFGLGAPYGNGNGSDPAAPPVPVLDVTPKVSTEAMDLETSEEQTSSSPVTVASTTKPSTVNNVDMEQASSLSSQSNGQSVSASQDSTDSASETSSNPGHSNGFDVENWPANQNFNTSCASPAVRNFLPTCESRIFLYNNSLIFNFFFVVKFFCDSAWTWNFDCIFSLI